MPFPRFAFMIAECCHKTKNIKKYAGRLALFALISNPYRREIIKMLKWKNMNAGEIAEHFNISQPSISRHLDVLKRAEIVTSERKANQIIYSLNLSVMQEMYMERNDLFDMKAEKRGVIYECE